MYEMNNYLNQYRELFSAIKWDTLHQQSWEAMPSYPWLSDNGSLSQMLASHCHQLDIDILFNGIAEQPLNHHWLREVILKGDEEHWVFGCTSVDLVALNDAQIKLMMNSSTPIGFFIFQQSSIKRDQMRYGSIQYQGQKLLARQSRLWVNDFPLNVAELFLPLSPIYRSDKK